MRLRAYDDGKVDGLVIAPLEACRGLLSAALAPRHPIANTYKAATST